MHTWTPSSWQDKKISHQPDYPDAAQLKQVVGELSKLPPLVTSWEIEALKTKLAKASRGEFFLLQGGDCAESFDACDSDSITSTLKILLQMSLVLVHGTRKKIVRVGRIAGQYAKPRSDDFEERDGVRLPTYRGDLVNRIGFTVEDRTPNPRLLLKGYERAALTLNFIRSLSDGGFSDLHHPEYWDLSFVEHSKMADEYRRIVESIKDSIAFMDAITDTSSSSVRRVDFYTSHEGLSLFYEQAQTRKVPRREGWYNLSTHYPWLGMRTTQLDNAHVEYFRGICNPIGIKVGPDFEDEWLGQILERLNPENEEGRITLIHRFGASGVEKALPRLIENVQKLGAKVLFCVDPMHGNTEKTASGLKTRRFDNILFELKRSFQIHEDMGSIQGGAHFELTGDNVTECIGGARGLDEEGLKVAYHTSVDPRLNYEQALELAMLITRQLRA